MLRKNKTDGSRLILYSGLLYDTTNSSDVNTILNVKDKGWIICEVKYKNKVFSAKQRQLLDRLVEDLSLSGKFVVAMVVDYQETNTDEINVQDCIVRLYKINKQDWITPSDPITAKEAMDWVYKRCTEGESIK